MILIDKLYPYLIAAAIGAAAAWWVQGLRIESIKIDLRDLKSQIDLASVSEQEKNEKINRETSDAWQKNLAALHDYYRAHPIVERVLQANSQGNAVPGAAGGATASTSDTVPAPAEGAEDAVTLRSALDSLAHDCAETTLQCVMLQDWERKISEKW